MAIRYIDLVNGNDSNNGTTWALARKTFTNAYSAGDEVRIARSSEITLVGTASWTDGSKAVVFPTGSLQVIKVDDCNSGWTAGVGVTLSYDNTFYRLGTATLAFKPTGSCSGGYKLAHKQLDTPIGDVSGYRALNFVIRGANGYPINANQLRFNLCSDNDGNTPVYTFNVNDASTSIGADYQCITTGTDIKNINSISITAIGTVGTLPLWFVDNIFISKAPTASDGINIQSMISKTHITSSNSECWYNIQSIDISNNTINIDHGSATSAGGNAVANSINYNVYSGVTENANVYKLETVKAEGWWLSTSTTNTYYTIASNGTLGNPITYSGGWNKTTNEQDSMTIVDGRIGRSNGLKFFAGAINYFNLYNFGIVRFNKGYVHNSQLLVKSIFNNVVSATNTAQAIEHWGWNGCIWTNIFMNNNGSTGYSNNGGGNVLTNVISSNNYSIGFYWNSSSSQNRFYNCKGNWNRTYGFQVDNGGNNQLFNCEFRNNGTAQIKNIQTSLWMHNTTLSGTAPEFEAFDPYTQVKMFSNKHDKTADNHWIYSYGGTINSQTAVRHTDSGIAWKMSPVSSSLDVNVPLDFSIAKVAVTSGSLATVSCWMNRNHTGISGNIMIVGGQIAGVDNTITGSIDADSGSWQEVSCSFTPSENGVVEVVANAFGGSTYSLYVDDFNITQS